MTLRDRIDNPDRREAEVTPIVERRGGTEQRVPTWIKRMQDGKLKGKDLSGRAA